ncbi:uncharacterized protein LOC110690788 [Chenopodium quinoa]|uniref:uncharacterized protein LOC110690788 n=1 Tax=Chenopodium quinoa TaxID=63459 RepID=UPI000B78C649|nr:uncharacterized protein LOC110690788 [Chenopodium quinoa]
MYVLFWRACNASSAFTFRKAMEKLQKAGGEDVMTWFADLGEKSKWSKHAFDPNVCNDSNTSNFVESFNSTLGVNRCRPILTFLEGINPPLAVLTLSFQTDLVCFLIKTINAGIRRVCMVRIATRMENARSWKDEDITPKIVKLVKEISKASSKCRVFKSIPSEYEIHEGRSQFPLSLNKKVCSCGAWQLTGVPCKHAIRACIDAKLDPHDFVNSWYSVKTYKQAYSVCINPIPDTEQWPADESGKIIMPPKMKRGIGRPSRNRKREEGEEQPEKRSKTVKCRKCGCFGHNKTTCKGGLT